MKCISTLCLGLVFSAGLSTLSSADSPDTSAPREVSSKSKTSAAGAASLARSTADSSKVSPKESKRGTEGTEEKIKSSQRSSSSDQLVESSNQEDKNEAVEPALLESEDIRSEPISKLTIGATAVVVEAQSKIAFLARVDTGAASCSIHCDEWEISDEQEEMEDNIGREIRVRINNGQDQAEWVDSRIDRCVTVKTSEKKETRYKVSFTFQWGDFEKEVVVTLNNRGHMNYPLLLGRNFLESDFLVDIDLDEKQ